MNLVDVHWPVALTTATLTGFSRIRWASASAASHSSSAPASVSTVVVADVPVARALACTTKATLSRATVTTGPTRPGARAVPPRTAAEA